MGSQAWVDSSGQCCSSLDTPPALLAFGWSKASIREHETIDSTDLNGVRKTLWTAADQLRANSTLAPGEYRGPYSG